MGKHIVLAELPDGIPAAGPTPAASTEAIHGGNSLERASAKRTRSREGSCCLRTSHLAFEGSWFRSGI
jgi:hypothetical protein